MSDSSESNTTNPADLSSLAQAGGDATDPKDGALAALEAKLDHEKDARMEERFLWVVACVVLIDVIWFKDAANPTFPIVIMVLELVALAILARRWQVEEISSLVERVIQSVGGGTGVGS